jgi:hypothetical protein
VLLRLSRLAVVVVSDGAEWWQICIVVEAAVHVEVRLDYADPKEAVVGQGSWRRWTAAVVGRVARRRWSTG